MNRKECLEESIKCVCTDRKEQYGSPENNFSLIASLWSEYIDKPISAEDVAMMMALLKIARIKTGKHKDDNYVDLAGYAACACELRFADVGKTCKEPTEGELIDRYGVDKKTNEPMRCSEIGGCRKCLFAESDCYDSMREWIKNNFTGISKMVDCKKAKFRLEDYPGKYVMHCDTYEKAKVFCDFLDNSCESMSDNQQHSTFALWNLWRKESCYDFNNGRYSYVNYFRLKKYNILEFDDFDWEEK